MYVLKLPLSEILSEMLFFQKNLLLNFYINGSMQAKVSGWNTEFAGLRTEVLLP